MERREHYDPEDIEQLLMERSFDELLEEERAYVLRHLSGREEYEAMRKLLHHVQRSEPEPELLDADPHVKAHVMQMFRDQRKPQWRIWLNSVGTFLMPEEASAMWRPALAFAALALVITAGVWILRSGDQGNMQIAEVKPVKEQEPAPPSRNEPQPDKEPPAAAAEAPDQLVKYVATEQSAQASSTDAPRGPEPQEEELQANEDLAKTVPAAGAAMVADEVTLDLKDAGLSDQATRSAADSLHYTFTAPVTTNSGYVTNWSLANAQGTVAREVAVLEAKQKKERRAKADQPQQDDSRNLAEDQAVIALLSAAW